MKKAAPAVSYLFHPLMMPTLGLLLLLNSGTYIALLDPAIKRAILFVMALGTLVFPMIMVPVLYYRNLVTNMRSTRREERLVPLVVVLILYSITFVYFMRLPLNRVIQGYMLSVLATLFVVFLANIKFKVCFHLAALGGLTGLIIGLIYLYETPLQNLLMLVLLASGITGSARLGTGAQRPGEIIAGYFLGFSIVLLTLLIY